ncbi:MAG: hypothetical protein Q8P06_00485 [Candidatus Azambacteria bacterium]|nr:hypothetical protein [Candidatus Azambacteria bacterium]
MKKILCVCYGNTCRSPMLQALLARELKSRGVKAVVESAGMLDEAGAPANEKAIFVMAEMGLDITGHLSRGVSNLDLSTYDKIVCLTDTAKSLLISRGVPPEKIDVLEVVNPYRKDINAYRACAYILSRAAALSASLLAKYNR